MRGFNRTWHDNAAEFGALTCQGKDVRLAVLVACSVEKGKGTGSNQYTDEGKVLPFGKTSVKVSAEVTA